MGNVESSNFSKAMSNVEETCGPYVGNLDLGKLGKTAEEKLNRSDNWVRGLLRNFPKLDVKGSADAAADSLQQKLLSSGKGACSDIANALYVYGADNSQGTFVIQTQKNPEKVAQVQPVQAQKATQEDAWASLGEAPPPGYLKK